MKKKKRNVVYLQYTCRDGSRTVAMTASIALMHYYGRTIPRKPIKNPKPFELYATNVSLPAPYERLFFPLVIAGLERTLGKAPSIPAHFLDERYHDQRLEDLDFREVAKHLAQGTPYVAEYEQTCLSILHWLKEQGEITELVFDQPPTI